MLYRQVWIRNQYELSCARNRQRSKSLFTVKRLDVFSRVPESNKSFFWVWSCQWFLIYSSPIWIICSQIGLICGVCFCMLFEPCFEILRKRKSLFIVIAWMKVIARWVLIFPYVFPFFSVYLIFSYQNACYGWKNEKNLIWSEFFMTDESFGGSV